MWPSILSTFVNPLPTDKLNSPSHSSIETAQNSGVTRVETFIGVLTGMTASAVGTMLYDSRSPDSDGGGHVQTAVKGGTGQTSYNKGDILVASSASVLTKLAVGADGLALVAASSTVTGIKWGSPGATPTMRVYEYSSSIYTWSKPTNPSILYAIVEIIGGGGGGGSVASGGAGGGGGGGGYGRQIIAASALPAAASIIVGVGGPSNSFGGTTYFGSVLTSEGGKPGAEGTSGGGGSVLASATLKVPGGEGRVPDNAASEEGGAGGDTVYGFGGRGGVGAAGAVGTGYGAGGGGAQSAGGNAAGGVGAGGMVSITEYT